MDHFNYRDGVLYAEDVPLTQLADKLGEHEDFGELVRLCECGGGIVS